MESYQGNQQILRSLLRGAVDAADGVIGDDNDNNNNNNNNKNNNAPVGNRGAVDAADGVIGDDNDNNASVGIII